jgi:hypothetical protein
MLLKASYKDPEGLVTDSFDAPGPELTNDELASILMRSVLHQLRGLGAPGAELAASALAEIPFSAIAMSETADKGPHMYRY